MRARWSLFLIPSLIVTLALMIASQYIFLRGSFYRDLGLGRTGDELELSNYIRFFSDNFYLASLWLTVRLSALATIFTIILAFPVAYVISRMRSRFALVMLAAVVMSSFITIVIKVFGLMIIFSSSGWLNQTLMSLGIISQPFTVIGSSYGVVIGLMHFCLGFSVLLLYSVMQTIPISLEEAAQIHGAHRIRVFQRVIFPISLPGVIIAGLILFNLNMGAFTSAALLGGGRILTLPVLIQRTVIMEASYSMAGALAAVLLVAVLLINLLAVILLRRLRATRGLVT